MKVYIPKEDSLYEPRIAMVPQTVEKLKQLNADIYVDKGLGKHLDISDDAFTKAGAMVVETANALKQSPDMVLRVMAYEDNVLANLKPKAIHISFLNPYKHPQIVATMQQRHISAFSMELIPRISRAQAADALTSQSNLAGYYAVILAAQRLNKVFPMMSTAAGTIAPANVFVIGVGVAGLQAIATAKRLGARVFAFDTRPEVEEQVKSLGARFVKASLGKVAANAEGYAEALTDEQIALQRQAMLKACNQADVIITTALVLGKKAPLIITDDMLKTIRPGSLIIDLAAEAGGNVEGVKIEEEVVKYGVRILGLTRTAGCVAKDASELYANNLYHLISLVCDNDLKQFTIDHSNEIISRTLLTHAGQRFNNG